MLPPCGAARAIHGMYGTPEAGTRTAYVPWRTSFSVPQVRTLRRRPARSPYVQYGDPGACVSAQFSAVVSPRGADMPTSRSSNDMADTTAGAAYLNARRSHKRCTSGISSSSSSSSLRHSRCRRWPGRGVATRAVEAVNLIAEILALSSIARTPWSRPRSQRPSSPSTAGTLCMVRRSCEGRLLLCIARTPWSRPRSQRPSSSSTAGTLCMVRRSCEGRLLLCRVLQAWPGFALERWPSPTACLLPVVARMIASRRNTEPKFSRCRRGCPPLPDLVWRDVCPSSASLPRDRAGG